MGYTPPPFFIEASPYGERSSTGDMLLVSDYGNGVCTSSLLEGLGSLARAVNVPILVDPARVRNWSDFGKVTLIKANWSEATAAVGSHDVRALDLASRLAGKHYFPQRRLSETRCRTLSAGR